MNIFNKLFGVSDKKHIYDEVEKTSDSAEIRVSVSSHNGKIRDNNEDNYFVNGIIRDIDENIVDFQKTLSTRNVLLEVCDGMGGESCGELAAKIATECSTELLNKLQITSANNISCIVNQYVNMANDKICHMLNNNESSRGGSTFAMVYIRDGIVFPFSLGDSRIYVYSDDKLEQISVDHTLAMRKYKANIYTWEEAQKSADSHKLTLFLGVDVDNKGLNAEKYCPFEFTKNKKILVCSDGLYDMCGNEEIIKILAEESKDYSQALVNMALQNGGIDNITCLVAEII